MKNAVLALAASFIAADAAAPPVTLSKDSFDSVTAGKTVFIKFYAPYCGHCQNLAPVWERLRLEWDGATTPSPTGTATEADADEEGRRGRRRSQGLVAEVDCTVNSTQERWCSKDLGIVGFPTLLYGDPSYGGSFLKEYNGEKTYEALSQFANDTLTTPFCSPANTGPCDDETKKQIESAWKLSVQGLVDEISRKEAAIDDHERKFKKEFDRMQKVYDDEALKHELRVSEIKSNVKLLKSVKATHAM